jgi:predicted RNase H-like HicB family nuclease
MSFLRALLSSARLARRPPPRADRAVAGPSADDREPFDDDLLLDAPDDRIAPALVAAAQGAYAPAAELLAATREGAEWENRDRYTLRLAAFAHHRQDWLTDWVLADPHHPDALLVQAELEVRRALELPAPADRLRPVGALIDAAAAGSPGDPVPWRVALDHARGTMAGHDTFEGLWEQAVRRSSHHYGCHVAALKYLAAQGSTYRECFDFAEQAAEDALPGSLIQALPLRAAFALFSDDGAPPRLAVDLAARIDRAADLAVALSAEYGTGDPWPAEVRNVLAYVLARRERWAEALAEFRRIGPYATSFPWAFLTDDPLGRFLEVRDTARSLAPPEAPPPADRTKPEGARRWTPGRSRSDGHYA